MSCKLCEKIYPNKKLYQKLFDNPYDESYAIVMENGAPYLYVPCDDWYYSDTVMQVNYCPKCGRKLVE